MAMTMTKVSAMTMIIGSTGFPSSAIYLISPANRGVSHASFCSSVPYLKSEYCESKNKGSLNLT